MRARALAAKLKKKGVLIEVGGANLQPAWYQSTGLHLFDWFLGGRGLPAARMVELAGPDGVGKSTLALAVAASYRKAGKEVVLIDAEHSFDQEMAEAIGAKELIVVQPEFGEEALDLFKQFVPVPDVGLIILDSVAALMPKAESDKVESTEIVGAQPRMISMKLRQIFSRMKPTSPTMLLINQVRNKIGSFFGGNTTTPGGRALHHWVHARISAKRGEWVRRGKNRIGHEVQLEYIKSKLTGPEKTVFLPMIWGQGYDMTRDLLEAAILWGIVQKGQSGWYTFGEQKFQKKSIGGLRTDIERAIEQKRTRKRFKVVKKK